jgi:hypothetical protein
VSGQRSEPDELAKVAEQLKVSEALRAEAQAHLRAASDVLQAINQSRGDVEPVFESILKRAVELCDAAYGFILRYDGQAIALVAQHNLDSEGLRLLPDVLADAGQARKSRGPRCA